MERRDVLKLGAVAAGLGGSGCASLLSNPGAVTAHDMDGFLASLDGAMETINRNVAFDSLIGGSRDPDVVARARHGEELAKKTLRSLLLVGTLRELPPEQVAHEGVQQRLANSMGEFDDAMFGMTEMLESLSPSERKTISQALQDDPNLGMRVMGSIDEQAAAFGISMQQRSKLRAVSSHTCARLRQAPELTLTEYTTKMRKVEARHGARSQSERELAALVSTDLLFNQADGTASGGSVGAPDAGLPLSAPPPPPAYEQPEQLGSTPGMAPPPPASQPYQPRPRAKASTGVLTAGGIALGVGAAAVGIGFLAGNGFAAVGVTIGAILGIAGLVTLIVGLIMLTAGK